MNNTAPTLDDATRAWISALATTITLLLVVLLATLG
jgi:hypothetical protein